MADVTVEQTDSLNVEENGKPEKEVDVSEVDETKEDSDEKTENGEAEDKNSDEKSEDAECKLSDSENVCSVKRKSGGGDAPEETPAEGVTPEKKAKLDEAPAEESNGEAEVAA